MQDNHINLNTPTVECPFCGKQVDSLKSGCHVIPRHLCKQTKSTDGKNILLSFNDNKLRINQSDTKGDFWCESCEERSADEDGYGAKLFTHKNTGSCQKVKGNKLYHYYYTGLDYLNLKNFLISIVVRDHLHKLMYSKPMLSDSEFNLFKEAYLYNKDTICITIHTSIITASNFKCIISPIYTKDKNGVSFKLMEYDFILYFKKPESNILPISLKKSGDIIIVEHTKSAALKNISKDYEDIVNNPENEKSLKKAESKV